MLQRAAYLVYPMVSATLNALSITPAIFGASCVSALHAFPGGPSCSGGLSHYMREQLGPAHSARNATLRPSQPLTAGF